MGGLRPWHIFVLVVVLVLLFGAKRLPDAARSLGRSLRVFKAETRGLREDDVRSKAEAPSVRGPLGDPAGQQAAGAQAAGQHPAGTGEDGAPRAAG